MPERSPIGLTRELAAEEERRRHLRNMQSILAIGLWGAGCCLLYLAWSLTQMLSPPFNDGLSTAVYLVTFFYIFAFWPIHSLVERLFAGRPRAAVGADQKP
jgi:hypothetical protein